MSRNGVETEDKYGEVMARSKPIELETRTFEKQGLAQAFFREMLAQYRPGERVSDADAADLTALLKRHNEYADKAGVGVSHFEVMNVDYGTRCFRVVRIDGTGVDFSYQRCIDQRVTA
jgi:hypothetical protein